MRKKVETYYNSVLRSPECPDCLNKVKRAFKPLQGANVKAMDYVRGLVEAEYDPDINDPESIAKFVARASGFGTRVIDGKENMSSALTLAIQFDHFPKQTVLDGYDTSNMKLYKETNPCGGEIDFHLQIDRKARTKPRDLLKELEQYGPKLKTAGKSRHQARINRGLYLVAFRTLLSTLFTIPILVLVWATKLPDHGSTPYRAIELGLSTCVVVIAEPLYTGSFRSAWYLHEADLGILTAISTLITYIFSIIAFAFQAAGKPFNDPLFETLGLLITLVFVGRTVQAFTRKLAYMATENVGSLQPSTARLLGEKGVDTNEESEVDIRLLHYDDILRVHEGEIVPTDDIIIVGNADLDESSITGESIPVTRQKGSSVLAGPTVQGTIDILVTRLITNNSLSSVIQALTKAQNSQSICQDFADRMAAILLPIAGIVSLISFILWIFVTRYIRDQSWPDSVINGIKHEIAIMAVACPCALTLSVSLVSCLGAVVGMREGIIFRNSEALLSAYRVKVITFDKTGTFSQGILSVSNQEESGEFARQIVYEITGSNRHPISVAIRRHLEKQGFLATDNILTDIELVPGGGIICKFMDTQVLAGNPSFTGVKDHPIVRTYTEQGLSLFTVSFEGHLIAVYGLSDSPRLGCTELIDSLTSQRKEIRILSGDSIKAVQHISNSYGELKSQAKAEMVQFFETNIGKTTFIGDGTNDSLALNQASISLAVGSGSGTDIAVAASSIVLLSPDIIKSFKSTMKISKSARLHALASITWCGVYFFFAILLASGAAVNFSIPPEWAGLNEVVSILPVIVVAGHLWVGKH